MDFEGGWQINGLQAAGDSPLQQAFYGLPGEVNGTSKPLLVLQDSRVAEADPGDLLEDRASGASWLDLSLAGGHGRQGTN